MLSTFKKVHLLYSAAIFADSAQAGKCPFGFGESDEAKPEQPKPDNTVIETFDAEFEIQGPKRKLNEHMAPVDVLQCRNENGKVLETDPNFAQQDYHDVADSINDLFDKVADGDKGEFAGCLVRLAGHDFMDYRFDYQTNKKGKSNPVGYTGGSDGCINFDEPDNKGLAQCLEKFNVQEAYTKNCDEVSLADFIVIAAETAMARTHSSYDKANEWGEGTLQRRFRDQFKSGRKTVERCPENKGLMPDAEDGCSDLLDIFKMHIFKGTDMKFWRKAIPAILGAHTLGAARPENSGYKGTWSSPGSEAKFDNDYYRQLLTRGWGAKKMPQADGSADKNQWKIIDGGAANPDQLMLNVDMCMAYDNNPLHSACMIENGFKNKICKEKQNKGKSILAQTSKNCCAWTNKMALLNNNVLNKDAGMSICGKTLTGERREPDTKFLDIRGHCCKNEENGEQLDCDSAQWPKGIFFRNTLEFAGDEKKWINNFMKAWKMATENGHLQLNSLDDTEDKYDCDRLFTFRMCSSDASGECEWVKNIRPHPNPKRKGKFIGACVLKGTEPSTDTVAEQKASSKKSARGSKKSRGSKSQRGSKGSRKSERQKQKKNKKSRDSKKEEKPVEPVP